MPTPTNHYATLGLARGCTEAEIRAAYRALARLCHPDLHPDDPSALTRTQALNLACATLTDPARRRAHDVELAHADPAPPTRRSPGTSIVLTLSVAPADLLRGATRTIQIRDPAQPSTAYTVPLAIPPGTAPGTRIRLAHPIPGERGRLILRVKARPDPRFKPRGCDLRCDLRISAACAAQGGTGHLRGLLGQNLRVTIPARCARGTLVRIPGEGLPRAPNGRGDLLVRLLPVPPPHKPAAVRSSR